MNIAKTSIFSKSVAKQPPQGQIHYNTRISRALGLLSRGQRGPGGHSQQAYQERIGVERNSHDRIKEKLHLIDKTVDQALPPSTPPCS